jgi:hypothetical protein
MEDLFGALVGSVMRATEILLLTGALDGLNPFGSKV